MAIAELPQNSSFLSGYFGIEPPALDEIKKIYTAGFEKHKPQTGGLVVNVTADSIWTVGEKFIEAGANPKKVIQTAHKVQRFALEKSLGGNVGKDVVAALEKAITTKDKYDLAEAMGLLYSAHLGNTPQALVSFSEDTSNVIKQYISEL